MANIGCGYDHLVILIDERTRLRGDDDVAIQTVRVRRRFTSMPGHCPELGRTPHVSGQSMASRRLPVARSEHPVVGCRPHFAAGATPSHFIVGDLGHGDDRVTNSALL